jgi:hypothetical protein
MPGNQEDEELGQSGGVDGGGGGGREGASARGAPGHSRGGRKRVILTRSMILTMACVVALALAGTAPKMFKWSKDRDSRRSSWVRKMQDALMSRISRGRTGAGISILAGGGKVVEEGLGMAAMELDQSIGSSVQGGVDVAGHNRQRQVEAEPAARTRWNGNETVREGVAAAKSASDYMPPPPPPPSAMSLNGPDPSAAVNGGMIKQANETMTSSSSSTTTKIASPATTKNADEGIRPWNVSEHGNQRVVAGQASPMGGLSTTAMASGTGRGGRKQRAARQEEGDSISIVNPTIAECNLPDIAVVPRAYPQLSVGAEQSHWWSSCYFWNTSRANGTFRVRIASHSHFDLCLLICFDCR